MIDPTCLQRPMPNASEFALFACCVQGKSAKIQADKFNEILEILYEMLPTYEDRPFACIRALTNDELEDLLAAVKIGQYKRIVQAWRGLSDKYKDDSTFTVAELENCFGIGPKTSRFIVGYCYNIPVAILDCHILNFLRSQGIPNVPKNTPQDRSQYALLETALLNIAREKNVHPLELDTQLWNNACA